MTKDRTEQFHVIRTKVRRFSDSDEDDRNDRQGLVQSNAQSYQSLQGVMIEDAKADGFSEVFKQAEDIRSLIETLQDQIDEVSQSQSQILSSPIPDEKSKSQLEDFMSAVKRTSLIIRKKLKEMESWGANESCKFSMAAQRTNKIQYQALLKTFVDKMTSFQTLQTNYMDGCKERIRRQLEISGSNFTEEQVDDMLEAGNWQVFSQGILTDTEIARKNLKQIEARHNEIIKLEQSIRELHGMFVEMAILVESQGVAINSIEKQVQEAQEHVTGAESTLKIAKKHQTSARKKKICIGLTVSSIVVITIVVVVLLH